MRSPRCSNRGMRRTERRIERKRRSREIQRKRGDLAASRKRRRIERTEREKEEKIHKEAIAGGQESFEEREKRRREIESKRDVGVPTILINPVPGTERTDRDRIGCTIYKEST